ncbi:alpha/beta hydrolase [Saccharomonospora sp. NPDC006951]
MPFGYLTGVVIIGWCTFFAVFAPAHTHVIGRISFWSGIAINELPFYPFLGLVGSTALAWSQGDLSSPGGWVSAGCAGLTAIGLVVIQCRAFRAAPVLELALDRGLGADRRSALGPDPVRRPAAAVTLLLPLRTGRRDVTRIADIGYGPDGRRNLLDVYVRRDRPLGGPVLVYLHGGGYFGGDKSREARALLTRMASRGWVCLSATYRLRPSAGFVEHLVDAKKVLAWAREHAKEYGGDPSALYLAGSSAGAHLTALAALTPNDPVFQPGFEDADTTITAAICLYGYYGYYYGHTGAERPASSPLAWPAGQAPPFFLTHGTHDTYTSVEGARKLAGKLRAESANPVVYAELGGAQHSFDRFRSIRFDSVVTAIEAFTTWVETRRTTVSQRDIPPGHG